MLEYKTKSTSYTKFYFKKSLCQKIPSKVDPHPLPLLVYTAQINVYKKQLFPALQRMVFLRKTKSAVRRKSMALRILFEIRRIGPVGYFRFCFFFHSNVLLQAVWKVKNVFKKVLSRPHHAYSNPPPIITPFYSGLECSYLTRGDIL